MRRNGSAIVLAAAMLVAGCSDSGSGPSPRHTHGDAGRGPVDASGAPKTAVVPPRGPRQPDGGAPPPCNSAAALCSRRYDEIGHLGAHRSAASGGAWSSPAQHATITEQLASRGVRALDLELHEWQGVPAVCAGSCALGSVSVASTLDPVATFLSDNPRDVVTLVLTSFVEPASLVGALDAAGLSARAHAQAKGTDWPTLGELVAADERLVVFARWMQEPSVDGGMPAVERDPPDAASGAPAWLHAWKDWFWATAESGASLDTTGCMPGAGDPASPLIELNHLLPDGAAGEEALLALHAPARVAERLRRCHDDRGRYPTIVMVDFVDVGDPNGGVQIANGLR